jgi:hypothetical protein
LPGTIFESRPGLPARRTSGSVFRRATKRLSASATSSRAERECVRSRGPGAAPYKTGQIELRAAEAPPAHRALRGQRRSARSRWVNFSAQANHKRAGRGGQDNLVRLMGSRKGFSNSAASMRPGRLEARCRLTGGGCIILEPDGCVRGYMGPVRRLSGQLKKAMLRRHGGYMNVG